MSNLKSTIVRESRALKLVKENGQLWVEKGDFCASLACASNEYELTHLGTGVPIQLTKSEQLIVDKWEVEAFRNNWEG